MELVNAREASAIAAMKAAASGHIVLSTLHARDAVGAIATLRQWGINNGPLATQLSLVINQRLFGRLCRECKYEREFKAALINLRQGKGTRSSDQIPQRAMGPVFLNEYESRADYYDDWLKEQVEENAFPDDPSDRHRLIMTLREKAYQDLCDAVYREKGYSPDAIPLPETLERFDLADDQAMALLKEFGIQWEKKRVSN